MAFVLYSLMLFGNVSKTQKTILFTVADPLKEIRSWRPTGHLPTMQPERF